MILFRLEITSSYLSVLILFEVRGMNSTSILATVFFKLMLEWKRMYV